ncbi:hypothetical protein BDW74DRAFT_181016 [Aspergillus multicolor]|uniref:uncharacterized protein n=1 Tax=Aspergillus multicolor TaxID=41759 RepID=UPI003CCDC6AE
MSLQTLPLELVLLIAEHSESYSEVLALTLTSIRFASILAPRQLEIDIKHLGASTLTRAVETNNTKAADVILATITKNKIQSQRREYLRPRYWKTIGVAGCRLYKFLQKTGKFDNLLYVAVDKTHLDMVRFLLQYGADPRAGHENHAKGEPAAHVRASQREYARMAHKIGVELVFVHGADMAWVVKMTNSRRSKLKGLNT